MYSTFEHLLMMQDRRRIDAYMRAIRATVRPGDVVLDLGSGAGVMGFLALEAGAAHVFAVEPSASIELGRKIAADNGISKITFFKADIRKASLPRPVDLIIADLRGAVPILGDSLTAIAVARDRDLARGGRIIPKSDRIFLSPLEAPHLHDSVAGWKRRWGATDYTPLASLAANQMRRTELRPQDLLAPATALTPDLDYAAPFPKELALSTQYVATRAGTCDGLGAWFEATLADGITMSTAPDQPLSIYGHAYFPIEVPIAVAEGTVLHVDFRVRFAGARPIWSWSVSTRPITAGAGRHSSLKAALLSPEDLRLRTESHIPTLGAEAEIDRAILSLIDGRTNNGQIAEVLRRDFPSAFPTLGDALTRVGTLLVRYGKDGAPHD